MCEGTQTFFCSDTELFENAYWLLFSDMLQNETYIGIINKEFVDKYIDKIFATPEDGNTLHLQIKLSTGEVVDKQLENLRVRTGHTFKKMIEAYEQGLQ